MLDSFFFLLKATSRLYHVVPESFGSLLAIQLFCPNCEWYRCYCIRHADMLLHVLHDSNDWRRPKGRIRSRGRSAHFIGSPGGTALRTKATQSAGAPKGRQQWGNWVSSSISVHRLVVGRIEMGLRASRHLS